MVPNIQSDDKESEFQTAGVECRKPRPEDSATGRDARRFVP